MSDFELPRNAPPSSSRPPSQGPSGLAIAALVLSCLFFVPLLPLIGLVLGVIALIKAQPQSRGVAIAAVIVGSITFILNLSVCAAIAIPSFMKYIRRSKVAEARLNVRRLSTAVTAYQLDHERPPPPADWTPSTSACDQPGGKFAPDAKLWSGPPWSELQFSIDNPSYYQYRVIDLGRGQIAVEARGDLDCDGVFSLFRRERTGDGEWHEVIERELE